MLYSWFILDVTIIKLYYILWLFIVGCVRNISPSLWEFHHLTALYLNDNQLLRLPPDIGLLVNLRALDVSSNKLRSLPAELGELIQLRYAKVNLSTFFWIGIIFEESLNEFQIITNIGYCFCYICRELLLNNNFLRVLPYELGKLFHLHILGLMGNPLQKELLSIYNEPNGTQKLLIHMLDSLSSKYYLYPFLKIFRTFRAQKFLFLIWRRY